jgi:hypothetical protein
VIKTVFFKYLARLFCVEFPLNVLLNAAADEQPHPLQRKVKQSSLRINRLEHHYNHYSPSQSLDFDDNNSLYIEINDRTASASAAATAAADNQNKNNSRANKLLLKSTPLFKNTNFNKSNELFLNIAHASSSSTSEESRYHRMSTTTRNRMPSKSNAAASTADSSSEFIQELEKLLLRQFQPLSDILTRTVNNRDKELKEKKLISLAQDEWAIVAMIFDRILFFFFLFLTLFGCLFIFFTSPFFLQGGPNR